MPSYNQQNRPRAYDFKSNYEHDPRKSWEPKLNVPPFMKEKRRNPNQQNFHGYSRPLENMRNAAPRMSSVSHAPPFYKEQKNFNQNRNSKAPNFRNNLQPSDNFYPCKQFTPNSVQYPKNRENRNDQFPRHQPYNATHRRSAPTNNFEKPRFEKHQRNRSRTPEEIANEIKSMLHIPASRAPQNQFQFRGRLMEKDREKRMETEKIPSFYPKRENYNLPSKPLQRPIDFVPRELKFEYERHLRKIEMEIRRLLGLLCQTHIRSFDGRHF